MGMRRLCLWWTLAALALSVALGQQPCQDPTPRLCSPAGVQPIVCCRPDACLTGRCCPQTNQTVCPVWPGNDATNVACCDTCSNFLNPSFTAPTISATSVCCRPELLCANLGPNGPQPAKPPFSCCSTSCLPSQWSGATVNICCPRESTCGNVCCQPGTQCTNTPNANECCPDNQVCTNSATGAKTCCKPGTTCSSAGTCVDCPAPNSLCPNLLNPAVDDCCPQGNCQQLLPLPSTGKACCNQTFTCLDAGSLPNNKVLGCCKEPCSTFTNAAGAATSGVCCPWGAQTVTINGVVTRICCPQGTTVQPDGSCKACAAPTIPCNTWPTLGATQCCPDDQCLPVLPFNSTGPRACCPQGPICLDPTLLPIEVKGCCKDPCAIYTVSLATGPKTFDNICCPWPAQNVLTGTGATLRVCCPSDQVALSDFTCCRQQQLCGPPGKQVCCPAGQSCINGQCNNCTAPNITCNTWPTLTPGQCCPDDQCLPVLPFTSTGPRACCPQGPKCLDPALLPNQVRGCCREPCSTLITTAGQNISGVCCKQGATNVTAADGTTSRICCADGFPAQTDGTCCKTPQQCTNSVGFKFCCPPGQTCQGGQCLDITIPTNNCTAPNVTCNGLPNFTPGGCCRNETCLQVFDPTPPPGTFLGNNATGCCPEANICKLYNPLAPTSPNICCKGTCANVVLASTPPQTARMCCPWQPQSIPGTNQVACCSDDTVVQSDGTCCKPNQVCTNSAGVTVCCPDSQQCQNGQCLDITVPTDCTPPNVTCNIWPTFQPSDCCRNATCLQGFDPSPPPGVFLANNATACCPPAKICLLYNPLASLTQRVCCTDDCAFVVKPATATSPPIKRRMCCPWKPQVVTGLNFPVCCPDDTTALTDGSCCNSTQVCPQPNGQPPICCPTDASCNPNTGACIKECPPPNITCPYFPSLLPGDCCKPGTCRQILNPLPPPSGTLSTVKACCPASKLCRRYSTPPALGPLYCCNGTCANVVWADGTTLRYCCPYPLTVVGNKRYCCPPNNIVLQPGGQCCPKAQVYIDATGKQACCPKGQLYTDATGKPACCPDGTLPVQGKCCPKAQYYTTATGKPACCPDGSVFLNNECCKTPNICPAPDSTQKTCCKLDWGCNTWYPPNTAAASQSQVCCPAARRCKVSATRFECCKAGQSCNTIPNGSRRCVTTMP